MNTEKQLRSLINSTRVLTSTRNLDEVLHLLIEEVLSVFDWADASVLFLYDEKTDKLKAESAVGFDMEYLKEVQLSPNEGMSGKTFSIKRPQLFTSSNDTNKGMSDLTEWNMDCYRNALGENHMVPTSTISAPLMHRDECFGVLTIDSFSVDVRFTEENLLLLQTFAGQAMIAIENATLISQNNRSNYIHEQLTQAYMTHRGLDQITKTLSSLIDKDVGVVNDFYDVLSATSARMNEIIESTKIEFPSEVLSRFDREIVDREESFEMYCFPIRIEDKAVGLLLVMAEKDGSLDSLDSLDLFAIEQSTAVFALELQSQAQYISSQFNEESLLINELLKGKDLGERLLKSKNLYHADNHYFIVTLEILHESSWEEQVYRMKNKFSRLLFHSLKTFPFKVLIYEKSLRYSLFIISRMGIERANAEISDWLSDFMEKSSIEVIGGGGRVFKRIEDLHFSITDSYKVLEYLKRIDKEERSFLLYSDLGVYRLLLNVPREELGSYVAMYLSKLIDYDEKQGTDLIYTLENYIDTNYSVVKTSKKLFVHENTVKYRLNKIKDILEVPHWEGELGLQIFMAIKAYTYIRSIDLSQ